MTEKGLACFAAAARSGSFSAAAEDLYTSQQNISYNIRKLEQELGAPLFLRRGQRVEMTPWGRSFYRWYQEFDGALAGLAKPRTEGGGSFTDVQIAGFLALAETGDAERAAEKLFYEPKNVLTNLSRLEKSLSVTLITRGRHFSCTPEGTVYYTVFSEAMESLEALKNTIRESYGETERRVGVGISEWLDEHLLLDEVIKQLPQIKIDVQVLPNQELLQALDGDGVDIALWSQGHAPVNRDLEMRPVAREHICALVPADGKPCPALICPAWPRSYMENRVLSMQEVDFGSFSPSHPRLVRDLSELQKLLYQGGGAALTDCRFGRLRIPEGMKRLPKDKDSFVLACRKSSAYNGAARKVMDTLRELYYE